MSALLKIVQGPNAGAEIALPDGVEITVGKADSCDIVLADPTLPDAAVTLAATPDGVTLDGDPLEPFHVRFLGSNAIAVGPADSAWSPLVFPPAEQSGGAPGEAPRGKDRRHARALSRRRFPRPPAPRPGRNHPPPEILQILPPHRFHPRPRPPLPPALPLPRRARVRFPQARTRRPRPGNHRCPLPLLRRGTIQPLPRRIRPPPRPLRQLPHPRRTPRRHRRPLFLFPRRRPRPHRRRIPPRRRRRLPLHPRPGRPLRRLRLQPRRRPRRHRQLPRRPLRRHRRPPRRRPPPRRNRFLRRRLPLPGLPRTRPRLLVHRLRTPPRRARAASSSARSFPVCGILSTPYPCLVLQDGRRIHPGGALGGSVVVSIAPDSVVLTNANGSFTWKP